MHTAIIKTLEERQRQIHEEGFSPDHDDQHKEGELTLAAMAYAMQEGEQTVGLGLRPRAPLEWPWDATWWKPSDDPQRNIIKAMALLSAEYDRLERAKAASDEAPAEELRYSTDDEWQSGIYDDLTDIIEDRELEEGDTVYIGAKKDAQATHYTGRAAESVIEHMQLQADEEAGEVADDYPLVSLEHARELQTLIDTWATAHCPPGFYTIQNDRPYTLTRDDIANARKERQA